MTALRPRADLATHEVTNQPPPLAGYNLFEMDTPLREALVREGAAWAGSRVSAFGAELGSERVLAAGHAANRYPPELRLFDRYGHRLDEVEFHSAYHEMMALGMRHGVHSLAWTAPEPGGHAAHTALEYMLFQVEAGVCCPLTMTYAAVPALRQQPEVADEWVPRVTATDYDPRSIPAADKTACTIGMAMTEKQGGSDVRANTTKARPLGAGGPGAEYELTGHKWFCSAPMSDAFLTLAYTDTGLSCFLVPRWRPDGTRNAIQLQRLKDKLGNRSNASSEIEYHGAWAQMVGEDGRGVRTIIEMVHHTRLDTALAAAGLMRQALVQAVHHCMHRRAFQRTLIDQPLMRSVLADLALEVEAATALVMRVARAYDEGQQEAGAAAFARIAVAIAKYWINKRTPGLVYEAMECLGGGGYVEESMLPRLYREAPLNSIWEGSGNVICLDVLRAASRDQATLEALRTELHGSTGADRRLDAWNRDTEALFADPAGLEPKARLLTERLAVALQASLLLRHAPAAVADAFCAARLGGEAGRCYGALAGALDTRAILERAWPALA